MARRLVALGAIALVIAGCSSGGPATPEQVAVGWMRAMAAYAGGAEWDLEAPRYRAGRTREQAAQEREQERSRECPKPDASECLFPEGVEFEATGRRPEGECHRVFVRTTRPGGPVSEGAVTVILVDADWRVIDWRAVVPDDALPDSAARDCEVSP